MLNITRCLLFFMVLAVFICFIPVENQNPNRQNQWSPEEISLTNTAVDCSYLSDNEKLTVQYCNLVRLFPQKFAEVELKPYLLEKKLTKNSYAESLLMDLKKMKSINVLKVDSVLFEKAKSFAIISGEKGQVGHFNFNNRMKGYLLAGENCDYGHQNALDIVMSLLIDEDVQNLGHRKNILNPEFVNIGISIQAHKKYNYLCVMDFTGKDVSNNKSSNKSKYSKKKKKYLHF